MAIKTYSVKTHGRGYKLSANFTLGEMACRDNTDAVKVDDTLITFLQQIRDHYGTALTINSAYRTPAHNKKVGGSPTSQHLLGKAADIVVKGVTPMEVAQYAEALGVGGMGLYSTFTHIDTRATKTRWDSRSGKEKAVTGFGGKTFAQRIQYAVGLESNTMDYLRQHPYADALMYKLSEAVHKKAAKGIGGDSSNQVQQAAKMDNNTMAYLRAYKYGGALLDKLAKAMK